LPAEFIAVWQVGEETGDLDESAARLGKLYGENADRRFQAVAAWTPRLIYAVVSAVMIYFIFKGFSQIYGDLGGSFDF
jgi:type II secretory pathway component PulF